MFIDQVHSNKRENNQRANPNRPRSNEVKHLHASFAIPFTVML